MATILVTGGAGYIASITSRRLLEKGYSVVVYDDLSCGYEGSISKYVTFISGDISEKGKLKKVIKEHNIDFVMHFAAYTAVGESVKDPALYYDNNVRKGIVFLETLRECGVNNIVFSSSAAVYGKPKNSPITEDTICNPINPYGNTKLIFEKVLESYKKAYGINYVALRYFNAAGAAYNIGESHDPETHLIPLVLQVALGQRESIKIFGTDYSTSDGTCVRDYVHVVDLADAHIAALDLLIQGKSGAFNVGSGRGYSVKEIIDTAREVTGHSIPAIKDSRRSGDPPELVASSEKIHKELRWRATFTLRDIIESAWNWHRKNPDGYKK